MSFTSNKRVSNGQPIKADADMDVLIANAENLKDRSEAAYAFAYANSLTLGSGGGSITWTGVEADTNTFWSAGSPTRFTVPSGFTRARFCCYFDFTADFASTSTGMGFYLFKNGSSVFGTAYHECKNLRSKSATTSIMTVSAADYFQVFLVVDSGTPTINAYASIEAWK